MPNPLPIQSSNTYEELTLTSDVYSNFKNSKKEKVLLGKKGTKVKLISDHDNVMIVESNLLF